MSRQMIWISERCACSEEALVAFGGCVIVVSHDRYFLNRVCTAILAFEGEGALRYHVGNYDYYLEEAWNCSDAASRPIVRHGRDPAQLDDSVSRAN